MTKNTSFMLSILSLVKHANYLEYEIHKLENLIKYAPDMIYWKDKNSIHLGCNNQFASAAGFENREDIIGKSDHDFPWRARADKYIADDKEVISTGIPKLNIEDLVTIASGKEISVISNKVPLKDSGVVGLGGIVEKEIENPSVRAKVHDMVKSADELLHMLNEILDVVSLTGITVEDIHEEPFDLLHLVQSIVDLEQSSVDLKKIELIQSIDPKIPSVLVGDHKKIRHILLKLAGNAIKFTKNGRVNINITLSKKLNSAVQLLFSVTDTGIGISAESFDKIFELFYKITPSYKGHDKGHGIGLHIVKTYTELLGGKVSVESKLNEGSKFSFTLTLKIPDKDAKPQNITPQSLTARSEEPPILIESAAINTNIAAALENAPEILVVEDNIIALNVAQTLVSQAQCNPTPASDGETALELVKTQHFDLILSDIGLPGISGIELAQQIRQFEKETNKKSVPIVAITGHAEGKIHNECSAAGINEVFIKPIRPEIQASIPTTHGVKLLINSINSFRPTRLLNTRFP